MAKKCKKPKHEKPSDVQALIKNAAATRYFRQEPWREHWLDVITAPPLSLDIAYRRLKALLSGPDPVNGTPSRHPSMDERTLYYDFVQDLKFPVTLQTVGGLDYLIWAMCKYAQMDLKASPPVDGRLPSQAQDSWPPLPEDEIDTQYIVNSIFSARALSMRFGYCWQAWHRLNDGLGLYGEEGSDSMRLASCAQLLSAGHDLRDWCAGRGETPKDDSHEGEWAVYEWEHSVEWWLYKSKESLGKDKFNDIVVALDTQMSVTENEWVKAVLAATTEHLLVNSRDLSSAEVFEVIFQKPQKHLFEDSPLDAQADAPPDEMPVTGGAWDVQADAAPRGE